MLQAIEKYPLLTAGIILIGIVAHWLWANVISGLLADISKNKINKAIAESKKLDKLYEANRYQLHNEMQHILRECSGRGYRSTHDTSQFGFIYSIYKDLGGNHDGDILLGDFEKIPLRSTIMLPIDNGDMVDVNFEKYKKVLIGHKGDNK